MIIPFSRSCLLAVLLGMVPLAHANFIREQDGALTTDLAGVSITPLAASPGTESWAVNLDRSVYESAPFPSFLSEPTSEPDKVNSFDFLTDPNQFGFIWTSDVPAVPSEVPDANPSVLTWLLRGGEPIDVSFEDLGDRSSGTAVPDAASTSLLLGLSLLGLAGMSRMRSVQNS